MQSATDSINRYLAAKDTNRPHLLTHAFEENATLTMRLNTREIAFPALSEGREAIGHNYVRLFGQTYENVYTFCMADPPSPAAAVFRCPWLVAMTEKAQRRVRVGCGQYDWRFSTQSRLVESLTITIEHMHTLPPARAESVFNWVTALPYPWCDYDAVLNAMPDDSVELKTVHAYLAATALNSAETT